MVAPAIAPATKPFGMALALLADSAPAGVAPSSSSDGGFVGANVVSGLLSGGVGGVSLGPGAGAGAGSTSCDVNDFILVN